MSTINWVTSFDDNNLYLVSLENKYKTNCKLSLNEIITTSIENKASDIFNFSVENEAINIKMKEIINIKDYKGINDLDLLEKEALIIIYINRYLLKNKLKETEKQFFIDLFTWIKDVSEFFRNKLNLSKIVHSKRFKEEYLINRCSYKFCNFKDNCEFNYDKKTKKCNSDHYVHNMVYADCDSLINYLVNNDIEKIDHHNEMMKCINTLMFVINHMYNELKNKIFYSKNKNIDELHNNNNHTDKIKVSTRYETLNDNGNSNSYRNENNLFKNNQRSENNSFKNNQRSENSPFKNNNQRNENSSFKSNRNDQFSFKNKFKKDI
jgi:hypothetical protein